MPPPIVKSQVTLESFEELHPLSLPEMPGSGKAVLRRASASMEAVAGLFGLGGGGWREGATIVLTIHGYLHLFFSDKPKTEEAGSPCIGEETLWESDIKASVYVPLATRCMFLRKGSTF